MSGAVLYKLGLDLVKSRPMEVSYGVAFNQDFKPGHHPVSKKIVCIDGVTRCENVMDWYVRKVLIRAQLCLSNRRVIKLKMVIKHSIPFSGIFPRLNTVSP